jgi:hypothetical protein
MWVKHSLREKRSPREPERLELTMTTEEKEFLHEGISVLTAKFTVPVVAGLAPRARARLNRYCRLLLRERMRYAEKTLYPIAVRAHTAALAKARLIPPFSLVMRSSAVLADEERGLLSLRTELTERMGGEPVTLRSEDTFSLKDGWPKSPGFGGGSPA